VEILEEYIDFVVANTSVAAYEMPFAADCKIGQSKAVRTSQQLSTSIDLYGCGGWTFFDLEVLHIASFKYYKRKGMMLRRNFMHRISCSSLCTKAFDYCYGEIPFESDIDDSSWLIACNIPTKRIFDFDIKLIFAPTTGKLICDCKRKLDLARLPTPN
jgi:hypothetical protein